LLSLKSFAIEKRHVAMQKLFIYKKRKKERVLEKMNECPRYLKQWVLRCPPKKQRKEMNKIAHIFLQSYFQVLKERYVFKERSRIRLATIYIPHTSIHMHISI
jgi:site-specific recombinase XerD